jgi:hypothetical protein
MGGLFTYILFWTFIYGMVHVYWATRKFGMMELQNSTDGIKSPDTFYKISKTLIRFLAGLRCCWFSGLDFFCELVCQKYWIPIVFTPFIAWIAWC